MAAIVAPAPLSLGPDIPFGLSPAPAHDPAVPRAVLAHSLAAAAALPALTPSLPPPEPEYRLASKRKTPDDPDTESNDSTKRPRTDDDLLFGPLCSQQPTSATPAPTDVLNYALEQALVAILTTPVPQEATSQPPPEPAPEPAPPVIAPAIAVGPSRLPTSPLASTSLLPPFEEVEAPTPIITRAYRPPRPMRVVEPPLWKVACRTRVETIIDSYGVAAVRATVAQEVSRRLDRSPFGSSGSRLAKEAMTAGGDLRVEIYTPSYFVTTTTTSPTSPDLDASMKSEFDFEDDVDMSFDLDDSDGESEEDEAEYEDSPHESVVDLPSSEQPQLSNSDAESSGSRTPSLSPIFSASTSIGNPICLPSLPPMAPPSLPRLGTVPVWCLRTYPDLPSRGTPSRTPPWARGQLTRKNLTISVSRATGPRMVGL